MRMKRVYTDDRFPGLEIVNEGGTRFNVLRNGQKVSAFESWEKNDGTISEACAGRRAADYFERLWLTNPPAEIVEDKEAAVKATSMEIDRLLAQESAEQNPERKQALRRHLLTLMAREETLAEAVVNHLVQGG